MTIPSKSHLSLLARLLALLLCLCCDTYHLLVMPPILLNQASNQPFLANRCLAMLPLCSAPLIALLVAGEDEVCSLLEHGDVVPCWNKFTCWDITISLILINASIYLVKGGRLGLMPGVLFHSCCPSFRHIGIMFPDFASLTRLGDLWDPLDSSL